MASPSRFLLLPAEVRVIIYSKLFSNLTITITKATQSPDQGPWAVMLTCRTCYKESVAVFYQLATISIRQEIHLPVLRQKIGPQNMARLRTFAVRDLRKSQNCGIVAELPATLRKLYLTWREWGSFQSTEPGPQLSDDKIRDILDNNFRERIDRRTKELLTKAHNLEIYLNATITQCPPFLVFLS